MAIRTVLRLKRWTTLGRWSNTVDGWIRSYTLEYIFLVEYDVRTARVKYAYQPVS